MMPDRILDLSEEPLRLHVRNDLLVMEREPGDDGNKPPDVTVPLEEIGVLVVSHPRVSMSHAVLAGLARFGGAFIACSEARLPVGMFLPVASHFTQAERFRKQANAALPVKKRLWQQLVRAKLRAQARCLNELHGEDQGVGPLVPRVRSGDPDNIEALAARLYWPALFADPGFSRNREARDQNALLNYGYAVIRAIVARAVCAAGLHPSLGVHHHNRYDAFCLADDLMEPFRPIVDKAVAQWVRERGVPQALDRECKTALLQALTGRFNLQGESRALFDIAARAAQSLAAVFMGERDDLVLPEP